MYYYPIIDLELKETNIMNVFFKNKDFRRFSFASFLSSTGDILFYMAFMTYASKLHNYSLALSLIGISESLPKLLDIFSGYLADRTQRKFKNIVLMAIIRFTLYGIVGFLFISNISQWNLVIAIIIINFISDAVGTYSSGLVTPLIVDIVGKEKFGEAAGFTNGVSGVITTVAQFAGAGLLMFLSYSSLAFINAFAFLAAGLLYVSVGLKHRKDENPLEKPEVNDQSFFETMRTSYSQVKKEQGLLTVVVVIALLNGILSTMGALIPIVMAGNSSTMIITSYSFTIATIGLVVSCGAILGSMFGQQWFKNMSLFAMTVVAIGLSFVTTIFAFIANVFLILPCYFLLAFTCSVASIKMQQWLVVTVDHKILASTVGLLNTIVMASAPLLTTIMTTISGVSNVKYALGVLLGFEIIILLLSIISNKKKTASTNMSVQPSVDD